MSCPPSWSYPVISPASGFALAAVLSCAYAPSELVFVSWLRISCIYPLLADAVAALGSVYDGIDAMPASKSLFAPPPRP